MLRARGARLQAGRRKRGPFRHNAARARATRDGRIRGAGRSRAGAKTTARNRYQGSPRLRAQLRGRGCPRRREYRGRRTSAEEALRAADAVERKAEVARSRLILARLAERIGDVASARAQVEALRDTLLEPLGMIAATRKAIAVLAAELGLAISTDIPTTTPTPARQSGRRTRTAE